jgi:16S rRNA (cytosine1402-N4)-methyltransferase
MNSGDCGAPRPPPVAGSRPDEPPAHIPVLCDTVVRVLAPRDDAAYVDGTFGGGGTSEALLAAARCRVYGIDRDPAAILRGQALARRWAGRLTLVEGRFGDMERLLAPFLAAPVAGITLDLGVSSPQLDTAGRGFSFRLDGPLDMRMSGTGETAAELVARLSERELAELIRVFGEERFARRIARDIVAARQRRAIRRTLELAEIVRAAVPVATHAIQGLDPATRTFQALRIVVNDELGELDRGLAAAERLLAAGGRLAVVSFHSLEDRRVKLFLRQRSEGAAGTSRHRPSPGTAPAPSFRLLSRRAIKPDASEIARNPRGGAAERRAPRAGPTAPDSPAAMRP